MQIQARARQILLVMLCFANLQLTSFSQSTSPQGAGGRYGDLPSLRDPRSGGVNPEILQPGRLPTVPASAFLPSGPNKKVPALTVAARNLLIQHQAEADAEDDLLSGMGPDDSDSQIPGAGHGADKPDRGGVPEGIDPHEEVFANSMYPSAHTCAKCHKKIYDEWRVSAHAYAAVSPMFHKFEQTITQLSSGTVGYFCLRCHAPVAVQLNFDRSDSILDAPYFYREGVTCVACHRVKERYGRVHGERRIEPGSVQDPVYGGIGGDGVAKAISEKDTYKIKLDPNSKKPGQEIHLSGIKFEQLSNSGFCQGCHQVAVHPGISLEVVWAQYRAGPACKKGISCQDCHMGLVPGKPQGYEIGAAAEMSGYSVNNHRKHSNHVFFGPGNSIAHPGIFSLTTKKPCGGQ